MDRATSATACDGTGIRIVEGCRCARPAADRRALSAAQQAGLKQIDILPATHFHGDRVEIARPNVAAACKAYEEQSSGENRPDWPGNRL